MEGGRRKLYAVALPFLAYSHFNAFLHLSRMLATRGVTVIYITLPSNLQKLRSRMEGWCDLPIYFQDLNVPESLLPPDLQNVNDVSRDKKPMVFNLIHKMRPPLETLMAKLSGPEYYESRGLRGPPDRLVLIYDLFMGWSAQVAAAFGIRSFTFNPGSAHMWLCQVAKFWDDEEPLSEINDAMIKLDLAAPDFVVAHTRQHMEFTRQHAEGVLVNTFAELEPKYVQHLKSRGARGGGGKPFWAVGPVVDLPRIDKIRGPRETDIMQWLDRQTTCTVVYVSFGTESYISPAQVTELALGLEASGQPFLWVLQPSDSSSSGECKAEVLPEGFQRRVEGRCLIESGWAPHEAILAHEATGGFITHCGWNSSMESVAVGVPMIALPLQSDQPANALLLAREAKVAVEMKMSNGVAHRDEVEKAVRILMAAEESEEMRRRVKKLSEAVVAALSDDGGAALKSVDSFIKFIS